MKRRWSERLSQANRSLLDLRGQAAILFSISGIVGAILKVLTAIGAPYRTLKPLRRRLHIDLQL